MNKSAQPVLDPKKVYSQGFGFHLSAIILIGNKNLKYDPYLAYPIMTSASFACELFLKSLLILEGRDHKVSHRLDKLFTSLSNKTKARIIKDWDGSPGPGALENFEAQTGNKVPKELPDLLRLCRNSYTALRYPYEFPLGDIEHGGNFLIQPLPHLLNNLILELRPDWIAEAPIQPEAQAR